MKEVQAILASQKRISTENGQAVLATVVDVKGSSYRLPGAKMLISGTGETFGTVSGGCLEADVLERAKRVLKTGAPEVFIYDTTNLEDSVFTLNMGCRGVIRILIEKAEPRLFEFLNNCVEAGKSGVIATLVAGDAPVGARLLVSENRVVSSDFSADFTRKILTDVRAVQSGKKSCFQIYDFGEVFLEFIAPPIKALVFGAGADAIPLVEFAKNLGWRVCVIDHRQAFATRERFPFADEVLITRPEDLDLLIDENSVAVVMTHNYKYDQEILRFLLPSKASYIGALGPKRRTESLLAELSQTGEKFTDEQLQKLHAPVGLDIGADTPETIALSIVAEIQSVLANRAGGFLRNRQGSIYNR
jgi:xanthine/CO dehydrogenase XdhC/CoxF family maturation factor